jgi:hypothetical protein
MTTLFKIKTATHAWDSTNREPAQVKKVSAKPVENSWPYKIETKF